MIRLLCCLLVLFMAVGNCLAQTVSVKSMGSATYGFRLDDDARREAMRRAALNALETYIAESSQAKVKLFAARRNEFAEQLDRFILASTVLSEDVNKGAKTYTVVVRSEVNAALLQAELDAGSAVQNTPSGERSLLTFVFVARAQASSQSFDDKVYQRTDAQASVDQRGTRAEETAEGEQIGSSSISTSGSIDVRNSASVATSASTTTGGSTTRKADAITWAVSSAAEVNTAMSGIFSNAGYEVVEAEYVEGESGGQLSVARIRDEFSAGNDLSSEVLRSTVNGIRTAGIPLMAFGTLDVGMQDRDPASGLIRIPVTVTGKVLDVSGRFPRTVTSVGPVQFFGLGPDASVARVNALTLAAEKAAGQMVDELNVKNQR